MASLAESEEEKVAARKGHRSWDGPPEYSRGYGNREMGGRLSEREAEGERGSHAYNLR